ncbi:MAG: formylglycine-generating enzyme family protein [Lentisphaeria bacterium]|nr:formylglycine-generating enzyme family protein [Lentisphaeria bacterium]
MSKDFKDSLKNLSPEEMDRIEARFKQRSSSAAADLSSGLLKNRRFLYKVILYAVAIIAVIFYKFHKDGENTSAPGDSKLPYVAKAHTLIGDAAIVPVGSSEEPSDIPDISILAHGSKDALDRQIKYSTKRKLPIEIKNSIGMLFRLIPPGEYIMGSPMTEIHRKKDEVEHIETMKIPLYMGKMEVTQKQFETVMGYNPSMQHKNKGNHPVEEVTWHLAIDFCKRLSKLEGLPRGAYRLPKETEWEYACRAGTQTAFHAGEIVKYTTMQHNLELESYNDLFEFANFAHEGDGHTEVGTLKPNAWGLHNMHGNVWEWCQNSFYFYDNEQSDHRKSIRGGNWYNEGSYCRSAARYRLTDTSKGNILGFRIIRVITRKTMKPPKNKKTELEGEMEGGHFDQEDWNPEDWEPEDKFLNKEDKDWNKADDKTDDKTDAKN